MSVIEIKMNQGEYWYGLCADHGTKFPWCEKTEFHEDYSINYSENQVNPILLSSQGRYIWCEHGYKVDVANGNIRLFSQKSDFVLVNAGTNLQQAYCAASKKYFPANGEVPPKDFFIVPQYNTWIELVYHQNQKDVLAYARAIIAHGYPAGILMIDDGWSEYYGNWRFHPGKFPDPLKMTTKLHDMGFKVMLWTCPFVSPDSYEFRNLQAKGWLVKGEDGQTAVRKWWNGFSGVLDMSNPDAASWFQEQLDELQQTYGIDGFKFDAGDGKFYKDTDCTYGNVDANRQNELWALFGSKYKYNEFRSCFKGAGYPLVQRLADRRHSWDSRGMGALIPNGLTQGISGYAFTCPDMVGGGEYGCFLEDSFNLDEELFVRYAQCAALMPMIQFSAAPWRVLSKANNTLCLNMAKVHEEFASHIWELAQQAAVTGEPIVRYMEYEFPGEGFEAYNDQFMLGKTILAAPVCQKGEFTKKVKLPKGQWRYVDGSVYEGGTVAEVEAPLEVLPYFIRILSDRVESGE